MSPDGRSLITSTGISQRSVWVHENGIDQQVSGEGNALLPAWGDGFPTSVFSPDGTKLYYLVETSDQRGFGSGELWVKDLMNGSNEAVLPGFNISSYDIAVDGQSAVLAAIDAQARSRRSAPRQLPPHEGIGPVFGADNEVYFRGPSFHRIANGSYPLLQPLAKTAASPVRPIQEKMARPFPGVHVIDRTYPFPGVNASVYAFGNASVQRNLYRITIP